MGKVAGHLGIGRVGWRLGWGIASVLVVVANGKSLVCAVVMWHTFQMAKARIPWIRGLSRYFSRLAALEMSTNYTGRLAGERVVVMSSD